MKEILHEYGFLIIAVIVVVALIVIVSLAKSRIANSANNTTNALDNMSVTSLNKARADVDTNYNVTTPTDKSK